MASGPTFSTEVAPPTFQLFLLHCYHNGVVKADHRLYRRCQPPKNNFRDKKEMTLSLLVGGGERVDSAIEWRCLLRMLSMIVLENPS